MKPLLVSTKNPGKFLEITTALRGMPFEFLFLKHFESEHPHDRGVFEEHFSTYEETAFQKAFFYAEAYNMLTLADDSGIEVDALKGEMGVQTRRWGKGEYASDEEWIQHFLKTMSAFPHQRSARFVCATAVANGKDIRVFIGEVYGVITHDLEAPIIPGLPLSSCFRPEGFLKVYAALAPEEKAQISHRGKALFQTKKFLETL
ncbi:hypothetical protein HYV57_01495 [Candidatus Peregrinibacteria bacterium]|nr:hypothetical protein [Candidatus Peregrinibacteria bacterium]